MLTLIDIGGLGLGTVRDSARPARAERADSIQTIRSGRAAASGRVDLQRLVRLRPAGERVHDVIARDRHTVEVVAAERVGDRADERRGARAHHGLADALRAERALRIRLVDGVGAEYRRHVEVARGLRLVEVHGPGQAILRVVDVMLERREPEAHRRAALDLRREALRMDHRAAVRDRDVVDDVELAGLRVELDLDEARDERGGLRRERQVVLRGADEARARERLHRRGGHRIHVGGRLVAVVFAAELDRALRRGRVREALARIGLLEHLHATDLVVRWRAAEVLRRDLLELAARVLRGDVARAGHRERRVAAELANVTRQVLARVAALDDAVVPVRLQRLRGDARSARVRVRAEVADAAVQVHLAVGRDRNDAVEAREAGRVESLAEADTRDLRAVLLAAELLLLLVVEERGALLARLVQVAARDRAAVLAELRVHPRAVDLADLVAVDAELLRGLVDQRLDRRDGLVVAGAALRRARRRVRHHRETAEAHRRGLVEDRHRVAGRRPIREAGRRTVLLNDEKIGGRYAARLVEADLDPALEARARLA